MNSVIRTKVINKKSVLGHRLVVFNKKSLNALGTYNVVYCSLSNNESLNESSLVQVPIDEIGIAIDDDDGRLVVNVIFMGRSFKVYSGFLKWLK